MQTHLFIYAASIYLLCVNTYGKPLSATVLNNPVKESHLKVRIEGVDDISAVFFSPKHEGIEIEGDLKVEKGTVIAEFSVSHLKPAKYEYRIRTRSKTGKSHASEAASVAFVRFTIDASLQVANPGEEGTKTLLGIDTDNDGVRDDLQRYLNENYGDKYNTLMALRQYAKASQKVFRTLSNKNENIKAMKEELNALECLMAIEQPDIASQIRKNFTRNILNTQERMYSEKKADLNFHGQGGELVKDALSLCEFPLK